MALGLRYLFGKYAGIGGIGELGGIELMVVCVRIEDREGRGVRNEGFMCLGAYMPSLTAASSGRLRSSWVVELLRDPTRVCEDRVEEEQHLKDISENIGYTVARL